MYWPIRKLKLLLISVIELTAVLPSPGAPSALSPAAGVRSAGTALFPNTTRPMWLTEPLFAAAVFKPVKNVFSQARTVPQAPPLPAVLPDASNTYTIVA